MIFEIKVEFHHTVSEVQKIFLSTGGGRKLENLDISYNMIGDIGIQAMANSISLGQLPFLKNLKMKEVSLLSTQKKNVFWRTLYFLPNLYHHNYHLLILSI